MTDFESAQKTAKKLRVHRLQHGEFIANEIDLHNLIGDIRLNTKKTIVVIPLVEVEKLKTQLQEQIRLWDNQGHLGIALQETDWLLGEFGRLRKLVGRVEAEKK